MEMIHKKRKTSSCGSRSIRLNVGGVKYETTVLTLKSKPGSMLDRMFEDNGLSPAFVDDEDRFFIDRNGHAFSHILEFLRSHAFPSLTMPLDEVEVLKREADYYGLEELKAWASKRMECRHITVEMLQHWMNCGSGTINLGGMDGSGLDLNRLVFPRIYAQCTNFQDANLARAMIVSGYSVFQNAIFSGANLEKILARGNFLDATFAGARMGNANFLSRSCFNNLAGADLQGAKFQSCYFMRSTNFRGANLQGASFRTCFIILQNHDQLMSDFLLLQHEVRFSKPNQTRDDPTEVGFPKPSAPGFPLRQLQFSDIEGAINADKASVIEAPPSDSYGL